MAFRSLTIPQAFAVSAGAGVGAFFADPYSTLSTRLVDPVNGVDIPGGRAFSQSWGGVSQSYQTYRTVQYGMTDWANTGNRRLGFVQGTYAQSANLVNKGAGSPGNLIVLQGDPVATAANMPFVDFSGQSGFAWLANNSVGCGYTVWRKLKIKGMTGAAGPTNAGGTLVLTAGNASPGVVIEYVDFAGINTCNGFTADNTNLMRIDGTINAGGGASGIIIRNCKFHDVINTTGASLGGGTIKSSTANAACIETYFCNDTQIYNCEFYNSVVGIELKGPPQAANPWLIHHNMFHDFGASGGLGGAIFLNEQSAAATPHIGHQIHHNLFYGGATGSTSTAIETANSDMTAQGHDIAIYNNTFDPNILRAAAACDNTNWQYHSNLSFASSYQIIVKYSTAGNLTTFGLCDFNGYIGNGAQFYVEQYAPTSHLYTWKGVGTANWQAAFTSFSQSDFSPIGNPDQNSKTAVAATDCPNYANVNTDPTAMALAAGSSLRGAGKGGVDIGYDPTNIGTGW